jgi:hypothetical protein
LKIQTKEITMSLSPAELAVVGTLGGALIGAGLQAYINLHKTMRFDKEREVKPNPEANDELESTHCRHHKTCYTLADRDCAAPLQALPA